MKNIISLFKYEGFDNMILIIGKEAEDENIFYQYKFDEEDKILKEISNNHMGNDEALHLDKHIDLCFISYAYNEDPNVEHRKEMEDFHYIKALLNKKISCSYFGISII